jgi:hypothetical protein
MLGLALDICRFSSTDKECVHDRHRDIIKKLKFITLIEQGERINVSTISTAPNNWFSSIYRSIFKESRQKTFQFLNEVIDRSFELIFLHKGSKKVSDRISCHQIIEDIMNSLVGIKHLQQTYSTDRNFYCDMETLLGSIFARLAELSSSKEISLTPTIKERLTRLLAGEPITQALSANSSPVLQYSASSTSVGSGKQEYDTTSPDLSPFQSPNLQSDDATITEEIEEI